MACGRQQDGQETEEAGSVVWNLKRFPQLRHVLAVNILFKNKRRYPMQENDGLRELCIKQGHVPAKCRLPGMIIAILASKGKDPCIGCNFDRGQCGGRIRKFGDI